MENRTPPKLDDFASLSEWKLARAKFFADLRFRDRTPGLVIREVVRTETIEVPVEVERVVYVDREVEVVREVFVDRVVEVEAPPVEEVEIPAFLRSEPDELAGDDFLASQQKPWEAPAQTRERLTLEVEALMNKSRYTTLTDEESARYQELTVGLGQVMAG